MGCFEGKCFIRPENERLADRASRGRPSARLRGDSAVVVAAPISAPPESSGTSPSCDGGCAFEAKRQPAIRTQMSRSEQPESGIDIASVSRSIVDIPSVRRDVAEPFAALRNAAKAPAADCGCSQSAPVPVAPVGHGARKPPVKLRPVSPPKSTQPPPDVETRAVPKREPPTEEVPLVMKRPEPNPVDWPIFGEGTKIPASGDTWVDQVPVPVAAVDVPGVAAVTPVDLGFADAGGSVVVDQATPTVPQVELVGEVALARAEPTWSTACERVVSAAPFNGDLDKVIAENELCRDEAIRLREWRSLNSRSGTMSESVETGNGPSALDAPPAAAVGSPSVQVKPSGRMRRSSVSVRMPPGTPGTTVVDPAGTLGTTIFEPAGTLGTTIFEPAGTLGTTIFEPAGTLGTTIFEPAGTLGTTIFEPAGTLGTTVVDPAGIPVIRFGVDKYLPDPAGRPSIPVRGRVTERASDHYPLRRLHGGQDSFPSEGWSASQAAVPTLAPRAVLPKSPRVRGGAGVVRLALPSTLPAGNASSDWNTLARQCRNAFVALPPSIQGAILAGQGVATVDELLMQDSERSRAACLNIIRTAQSMGITLPSGFVSSPRLLNAFEKRLRPESLQVLKRNLALIPAARYSGSASDPVYDAALITAIGNYQESKGTRGDSLGYLGPVTFVSIARDAGDRQASSYTEQTISSPTPVRTNEGRLASTPADQARAASEGESSQREDASQAGGSGGGLNQQALFGAISGITGSVFGFLSAQERANADRDIARIRAESEALARQGGGSADQNANLQAQVVALTNQLAVIGQQRGAPVDTGAIALANAEMARLREQQTDSSKKTQMYMLAGVGALALIGGAFVLSQRKSSGQKG